MGYTLPQIAVILAKADRTMYKIGAIAYDDMFNQLDESLDYDRDIIYIYKVAVEYADNFYVGTEKLDTVVERLGAKVAVYDFGQLTPIYSDSTIVTQVVPLGAALNDLSDVTITNLQDQQTLKYNAALGQWVNVGTGNAVRNTQQFTATAGQTIFTTAYQFDGGLVDIFVNGVKLSTPSYTVFGNYTIILTDGCVSGDIVEVVAYENNIAFIDLSAYYVPVGRTITINGVTYDLSANRSWTTVSSVGISMPSAFTVSNSPVTTSGTLTVTGAGTTAQYIRGDGTLATFPTITSGTVTSVDMSVPTGLTISGNPITTSGTLAVGLASGYSIPTTASQATWNTAYNDSIVSAGVTGTTTKTLTLNQQDGGTVTASWTDINTDAVTSVFGRTGAVVSTEGDYTLTQLGDVTLTSPTNGQVLKYNGTTWVNNTDTDTGLTSVGISMPSAFAVSNSPLTSNGTIAVTGAGTADQYVRGDGQLANFPTNGGGGSSVNYYLNGSVSQGTFGGDTYYEMSKTPIIGAGTDFTRTNAQGNGYIASFITDAGDPALLNIPGGNWNVEFYFQASSGGSNPSFYAELYKVSSSNVFTLIGSGSTNPEGITNGTAVDQYFTSIPVAQTALLATDRIAVRIFVTPDGRNITLHTENSNLCEVLTTFSTGLNALNGLTTQVQYFATGTSGTDFNISSVTDTHTFNLPTASATNRGALSSADWTTFNNKQNTITNPVTGTGTTNYLPKWTSGSAIGNSLVFDNGTNVGIGTISPAAKLHVDDGAGAALYIGLGTYNYYRAFEHIWQSINGTFQRMSISSAGNLLVGTAVDTGERAQISGSVLATSFIKSGGTSSQYLMADGSTSTLTNPVTGTGTTNYLPKWTSGSALGNSIITDSGSIVTVGGVLTVSSANINLSNNYNLTGRNAANTLNLPLIGRNGSDRIDIDVDGYGTTIGGGGTIVLNPNGGNVGIGTASPAYKLDVNRSSLGAIAQFITLDGTYNPRLLINGTAEGIQLFATYSSGAEALMFGTANTERMRLTSNLIIGSTVDSGEKLQVSGTLKVTGAAIFNQSISVDVGANIPSIQVRNVSTDSPFIGFYRGGTLRNTLQLLTDGSFQLTDASLVSNAGLTMGALNGTSATFSSSVTAASFVSSGQVSLYDYVNVQNNFPNFTQLSGIRGKAYYQTNYPASILFGDPTASNNNIITFNVSNTDTTGTEKMRLNGLGNLLVGTTTDSGEKLQVAGNVKAGKGIFADSVSVAENIVLIGNTNAFQVASFFRNANRIFFGGDTGGFFFQNSISSITLLQITDAGAATFSSSVTATSFIKSGGTSSQYLMADGSVTTGGGLISTNRQTASYTLALTDADKLVEMNVATANNLTVPLNSSVAFAIGTKIDLAQYGAGQTTVVATSGVTVRSAGGALKLALQYSGASLVKIATNEWYLFGDITV